MHDDSTAAAAPHNARPFRAGRSSTKCPFLRDSTTKRKNVAPDESFGETPSKHLRDEHNTKILVTHHGGQISAWFFAPSPSTGGIFSLKVPHPLRNMMTEYSTSLPMSDAKNSLRSISTPFLRDNAASPPFVGIILTALPTTKLHLMTVSIMFYCNH